MSGLRSPLRSLSAAWTAAREHHYNELLSNRLVPFLAAWEMFRDAPVAGVGPSGFATEYFDYRLRIDDKYRDILSEQMADWSLGRVINFGETHNEFLQTAAELGIVGLVLLIAAIVL